MPRPYQIGSLSRVHAAEDNQIRIGLIGCGGRGTGAVLDALGAATKVIYPHARQGYHTEDVTNSSAVAHKDITVVALADLFPERLEKCHKQLEKLGINVPKTACFTGIDAYQHLLAESGVNYVICATPPHFRHVHVRAAVDAGKNVFMEKPVAVDIPGVREVMEAGKIAKEKGLAIAVGLQRRHSKSYQETIQRIHDGAIGEILYGRFYWNGNTIWMIPRESGWSDMEWQLRNWPYFTWLSGDHIVEQHVHNLDVMNWVMGEHPLRVVTGNGGRQVRTSTDYGMIYDHFAVEFEFSGDRKAFSQCRQTDNCENVITETVTGTNGTAICKDRVTPKNGTAWRFRSKETNPYQQEHIDLIASIRAGKPYNDAQSAAESAMSAIIAREAVYSGKSIEWDAALKSDMRLGPQNYDFGPYPTPEVPMPGRYKFS